MWRLKIKDYPRITPAHAGSTHSIFPKSIGARDHPCSRREHAKSTNDYNTKEKSPLLTRGALKINSYFTRTCWITPAHAGSTFLAILLKITTKDHPCSRGEHRDVFMRTSFHIGSPLLARGARFY